MNVLLSWWDEEVDSSSAKGGLRMTGREWESRALRNTFLNGCYNALLPTLKFRFDLT